jgi:hypothetical protein
MQSEAASDSKAERPDRATPARRFAIIRALLKALILLLIPAAASCDQLDDSVRLLAGKVSQHLTGNEAAHVTARNISSLPAGELSRAEAALARALQRRGAATNTIEVALTLSENLKGYLLIAEVRRSDTPAVEMAPFHSDPPPAPVLLPISRRLLWTQSEPILDLAIAADTMLVLEPSSIASYERRENAWTKLESVSIEAPPLRDPRARMEIAGPDLYLFFPGMTCRGTIRPLTLNCEPVNSDFMLNGAPVRFTPGRNTIEGGAEVVVTCGGNLTASEAHRPRSAAPQPSKTLPEPPGGACPLCAGSSEDDIAFYRGTTLAGDPIQMPGPVTAFWPLADGALAVVHNSATKQFHAYSISVDCGH